MTRLTKVAAALVPVAMFFSASSAFAAAKVHIGIITGTVSQSEDDLRGAEALIKEYGEVKNGGMIQPPDLSRQLHGPAGDLHLQRGLPR